MSVGPVAPALPDDLAPPHVGALLATRWLGRQYDPRAACDSTNDQAVALARAGAPEGLVVAADTQSSGRGRLGRSWHSPPGENLYLSLLLRPDRPPAALPPLTLIAGVAAAEALAAAGATPLLKWPNDVLLLGSDGVPRKAAGILTEMATEGERIRHVVLGVGINVNGLDFPPELADRATSMRLATGRRHDRGALLAAFLNAFEAAYQGALGGETATFLARFRAHARFPRPCAVERAGELLSGQAIDIDTAGALIVRDDRGQLHRVLSGELHERQQSRVPRP